MLSSKFGGPQYYGPKDGYLKFFGKNIIGNFGLDAWKSVNHGYWISDRDKFNKDVVGSRDSIYNLINPYINSMMSP